MDARTAISHLEALAYSLGLEVRYERIDREEGFSTGGFCRIGDRRFIIINSSATDKERLMTLANALKRFDLSRVYLKPAVRELLEVLGGEETD